MEVQNDFEEIPDIERMIKQEPPLEIEDIDGNLHIISQGFAAGDDNGNKTYFENKHPTCCLSAKDEAEKQETFQCGVCSKAFTEIRDLTGHLKYAHCPPILSALAGKQENFQCGVCSEAFTEIHNLSEHLKYGHCPPRILSAENQENFQCGVCSEAFTEIHDLSEHLKYAHCPPRILSTLCRKKKATNGKKKALLPMFGRCKRCPYQSCSKRYLLKHFAKRHPGIDLDLEYKCKTCDDFFKSPEDVARHIKVSHVQRSLRFVYARCKVCKKSLASRRNLVRHFQKMHPEVDLDLNVEYKCKHCEEFFKTKDGVREHLEVAHPDDGDATNTEIVYGKICECSSSSMDDSAGNSEKVQGEDELEASPNETQHFIKNECMMDY